MDKQQLDIIGALARQGLTLKQIAKAIGISLSTLNTQRKNSPALDAVLKDNALLSDALVEASLYQRALGFDYTEEVHTESVSGEVKVKRHHKYMPADITACIYWLKNRQPDRWRERREDDDAKVIEVIMSPSVEEYSE